MSGVLISASNWLGYATAEVTVTAIAMWLLLRLCPVRSPAIQRFAWLLVLLPGVVVWRMSVVLPIMPVASFSGTDLRSEYAGDRPIAEVGAKVPSMRSPNKEMSFFIAYHHVYGVLACAVVLAGWLAGMIVLAARWAHSYVAFARGLPEAVAASDEWVAELREVCEEFGLPSAIPLHMTERTGPALCFASGEYRLLVPQAAWRRFSTQQRRSILRHELAHYIRGDLWKSLLARLLAWPQWFNPLAWLAIRRFEEAAECACDDAVVTVEPEDAFDYLRALLELGNKTDFSGSTLQAAVQGGSLQRRVRRLLSPTGKDSAIKKLIVIAAALSLAAGGFARIRFAGAQSPAAENKSAQNESAKNQPAKNEPDKNEPDKNEPDKNEPDKNEPAQAPAISLLTNGGFERSEYDSSDPQGWFATRVPDTTGHFLLSASSVAHGGQRSVVVEIGDSHPDLRVNYNWTVVAKGWHAGETYELSGWIKVENAKNPAIIMAQCWNEETGQAKMIGGATTEIAFPVKGTTDWTRVRTRLKVPEGTGVVRIRAGLSSEGNRGAKAWFDDLALVTLAD